MTRRDDEPYIVYHYTSSYGLERILQPPPNLSPSLNGIYGSGVYVTDIAPGAMSSRELSQIFLGIRDDFRFDHFVSFDARGLPVAQPDPNRPHVFIIPTTTPIDISNRLTGYGENQCTFE